MAFAYQTVTVSVSASDSPTPQAVLEFEAPGVTRITTTLTFRTSTFQQVEFEFDRVAGVNPILEIDTTAHPVHPSSLSAERLSIVEVFRRAGFNPSASVADSEIPLTSAGTNVTWSDQEMHDAMQSYWSRFANRPLWAMWVLFANQHDEGESLGGVMFDDIGPNHRQGTAVFYDSFISRPDPGETHPRPWADRMRFWTTVHEMGHAFNLAHSWQKSLGNPWLALADEPEARSFMNYPYNVTGGERAFFRNFEFRFSDPELLFLRHAPPEFVRMGDAAWFDNHGFQQAQTEESPRFELALRVNRTRPNFAFLEPVVVELKLTNVSADPIVVPDHLLNDHDHLIVVIKRVGSHAPARLWRPYVRRCVKHRATVLATRDSVYASLFPAAGLGGWSIAEPGDYDVQVAVAVDHVTVVSNRLRIRVRPPANFAQEHVAQDYFQDDVGRVLAFDGSLYLGQANDTLSDLAERFPDEPASVHAQVALGIPGSKRYRTLAFGPADPRSGAPQPAFRDREIDESLIARLQGALAKPEAAQTLGHVDYNDYATMLADTLERTDRVDEARSVDRSAHDTLQSRGVRESVLAQVTKRAESRK